MEQLQKHDYAGQYVMEPGKVYLIGTNSICPKAVGADRTPLFFFKVGLKLLFISIIEGDGVLIGAGLIGRQHIALFHLYSQFEYTLKPIHLSGIAPIAILFFEQK